jgi:hypothetical protein
MQHKNIANKKWAGKNVILVIIISNQTRMQHKNIANKNRQVKI